MKTNTPQIECADVLVANAKSASFDWLVGLKDKRWWATIALELVDVSGSKRKKLPREFYILACSRACLKKPLRKMPTPYDHYTVIQEELSMKELRQIAKERVSAIHAKSMEDFYAQMEKRFLIKG